MPLSVMAHEEESDAMLALLPPEPAPESVEQGAPEEAAPEEAAPGADLEF